MRHYHFSDKYFICFTVRILLLYGFIIRIPTVLELFVSTLPICNLIFSLGVWLFLNKIANVLFIVRWFE